MKIQNQLLLFLCLVLSALTACKKDEDDPAPITPVTPTNSDTAAPVITILGDNPDTIFIGDAYTDGGATALDAHDGVVTVTSTASATNPNRNKRGTYLIQYSATDSAGNIGTLARTVRVENSAYMFEGTYDVADTIPFMSFYYTQTITMDSTVNNRIHFNRFLDYANNTNIYGNILSGGGIEIPSQTAVNIGSGSGQCDIATHIIYSISYSPLPNGFSITYWDQISAPAICIATSQGVATFTRQ
jgi:hypothetical protein